MKDETKTEAGTARRGFFAGRGAELLCALLLAAAAAQMLLVISRKSITVDEWVMIPAGFYHVSEGDFRPVNEHPPFAKVLAALPLVYAGGQAPPLDVPPDYNYEYFLGVFGEFWRGTGEQFDAVCFRARVPLILVTVLLGALVFVYTRRYFGERAALFAVALFTLEPTVLAHGRVVQTDIPSALAFLVFCFTFYEYLKRPTVLRALGVGLAAGLAAVTKFSMIALGPVLGLAVLFLFFGAGRLGLERRRVAAQALALAFGCVLAVNAAYFFQRREPVNQKVSPADYGVPASMQAALEGPLELGRVALQKVFPADFVEGVAWQLGHAREGHAAGLLGQYRQHGWWYYFPVAFALKAPLPFLLLSLAGVVWALAAYSKGRDHRLLALLLPLGFFTVLLMLSSINIGVRYYLPAYVFLFILSGVVLDRLLSKMRHYKIARSLVAAGFLCWMGVEAARAFPDHMSYTNQLASSKPHWWYLSDSNVEWGDDVRELALYLRGRGERRVGGALLNWQLLERYGLEQAAVFVPPGEQPEDVRYVAIGASLLNGSTVPGGFDNGVGLPEDERVNYFERFRRLPPEKIFGGSIYLYRMKE